MGDVTQLIQRARGGDRAAFGSLFELLYPELRRIAHARLARNVRDTLMDTTALVHECYLKFSQAERLTPGDRAHFLSYAATVMRSRSWSTAPRCASGARATRPNMASPPCSRTSA